MLLLIPVIAVASMSLVFALSLGTRVETAILAVLSAITITLFAASLIGLLAFATYSLALAGWILLPVAALLFFRRRPRPYYLLPSLLIPALLIVAFYYSRRGYSVYLWDDLSLWVRMTKYLAVYDRLFDGQSIWIGSKSYPPGAALLNYFFTKFNVYTEPHALLAQFFLNTAAIAAIAVPASRNSLTAGVTSFATIILLVFLFQLSFDDTTVDLPMALVLAAVFTVALTEDSVIVVAIVNSLFCGLLILLKATGLPFALVGCTVTVVSILLKQHKRIMTRETAIAIMIAPAAALLAGVLWMRFSASIGGEAGSGYILAGFKTLANAIFNETITPRNAYILNEMSSRLRNGVQDATYLFGVRYSWQLQPIYVLLSLIVLSAVLCILSGKRWASYAITTLIIAAGAAGYILLLLMLYLERFSETEAIHLASFERYLGSYLLSWSACCISVIISKISVQLPRPVVAPLFLAGLVLLYPVVFDIEKRFGIEIAHRHDVVYPARQQAKILADQAKTFVSPGQRVYFINQADTGFGIYAFQFEMFENPTQEICWSLGIPYSKDDIATCDLPLPATLGGFSILVVANADEPFWKRYGAFFDDSEYGKPQGIYKIEFLDSEQKPLHLRRLNP